MPSKNTVLPLLYFSKIHLSLNNKVFLHSNSFEQPVSFNRTVCFHCTIILNVAWFYVRTTTTGENETVSLIKEFFQIYYQNKHYIPYH